MSKDRDGHYYSQDKHSISEDHGIARAEEQCASPVQGKVHLLPMTNVFFSGSFYCRMERI